MNIVDYIPKNKRKNLYFDWELFLRKKDGISTKDREEILRKMFCSQSSTKSVNKRKQLI